MKKIALMAPLLLAGCTSSYPVADDGRCYTCEAFAENARVAEANAYMQPTKPAPITIQQPQPRSVTCMPWGKNQIRCDPVY